MIHNLNSKQTNLLKKIVFMRMHELAGRVHQTGGFAMLLFADDIVATDALFEALFGKSEAERCRLEWRKIEKIGIDAYADDLSERGYC